MNQIKLLAAAGYISGKDNFIFFLKYYPSQNKKKKEHPLDARYHKFRSQG